jgi:ribose transport system substrate-binding protein
LREGTDTRYFVEAAAKVLEVLESFDSYEEELTASEVARRAGIPYSSAFRLLYTLEKRGYVTRRPGRKKYTRTPMRTRYRIGYAALDNSVMFSDTISRSMVVAARNAGIDLIMKDNALNPQKALANVDMLLQEKVQLMIIYQRDEVVAHLISAKCHEAKVPLIALNFAHPGAYYFGGNNYLAGQLAANFLCGYARKHWKGKVDKVLILTAKGRGSTQELRKRGIRDTLSKGLKTLRPNSLVEAPPGFTSQDGYRETNSFLKRSSCQPRRILIAALSDFLAIGASKAVEKLGLGGTTAIVGTGAARDARNCISRGGPFRASVAYFPESYGERVINLALKVLAGEDIPLTSYTNHVVLTPQNIRDYYPQ